MIAKTATTTALQIKNLKKIYANGVEALKGIDLRVEQGDFFALLGPNGAGKSTTIGILTTLVNPSSGEVSICGVDLFKEPGKAKSLLGVVPQEFNFSLFEKVWNIVVQQAAYYGVPKDEAEKNARHYLTALGLWEKRQHQARTLSGGMKRRLLIARALVHEPPMLILDEPTAGVDVELRRGLWDFLRNLNQAGKTIILTTHYLEEAENLCRGLAIINQGQIIRNTQVRVLLQELKQQTFILELQSKWDNQTLEDSNFKTLEGLNLKFLDAETAELSFPLDLSLNEVFEILNTRGLIVRNLRLKSNRLEELFLNLTGRKDGI
ncbi:MAG: ABC transporter ATP-binding protein [Gammaproteobacteria bacterium]